MAFLSDLVMDGLRAVDEGDFACYRPLIDHCFAAPPPFAQYWFGRRYFELAGKAEWFANSLVANAALEGYGSTQVWLFSNRIGIESYKPAIRQHALDESRHSTMFVRMLDLVFPNIALDEPTLARIRDMQPRYTPSRHPEVTPVPDDEMMSDSDALDEMVGIHLTEIRALILQRLLRPVLMTYAPASSLKLLTRASDILIRDEARHIAYTARIFDQVARDGGRDFLMEVFERRTREFSELTLIEVEREKIEI